MIIGESEVRWYFDRMISKGVLNRNMEFESWSPSNSVTEEDTNSVIIRYRLRDPKNSLCSGRTDSTIPHSWKRYSYVVSRSFIHSEIRQSKLDKLID